MSSGSFSVASEPGATADDVAVVRDGLHEYNFVVTRLRDVRTITLLVRDGRGAVRGGLLGYVWAEWLHITELWLAEECRGRGLGSELLETAEREAGAWGARGAFLSTFDFQAPAFYRRHGYEVYGTLTDCPPGHTDYQMRKLFSPRDRSSPR